MALDNSRTPRPLQILNLWAEVMGERPFPCPDGLSASDYIRTMSDVDRETLAQGLRGTREMSSGRRRPVQGLRRSAPPTYRR